MKVISDPSSSRQSPHSSTSRCDSTDSVLCIGNGCVVARNGYLWTERSTASFLRDVAAHVPRFCYCTWYDPYDDRLSQDRLGEASGICVIALARFHGGLVRRLRNGGYAFTTLLREIARADFVYLFWPGRISSLGALLCRLTRTPYGIYLRGEKIGATRTVEAAFSGARFIITAGDALRLRAASFCPDVENVVPMTALDVRHLTPPRRGRQAGPWNLLYVGRLEERKGVFDLLAAADALAARGVPFTLTLVGECRDDGEVNARLTPRVRDRVRMSGPVTDFEQLVDVYRHADIFVLPSHDEGFPRVLYEAMACGLPILTTFVGSIDSVMHDGGNCFRIAVHDPQDIVDKVMQLIAHPDQGSRMARAGHDLMKELLTRWHGRSHATQVLERLRGPARSPAEAAR